VVGETVSFLLGRFLLKRWVKELTADWPMWSALDAALSEDGWKLVALLRVSPVVPFSIINYALGSSSLPVSAGRLHFGFGRWPVDLSACAAALLPAVCFGTVICWWRCCGCYQWCHCTSSTMNWAPAGCRVVLAVQCGCWLVGLFVHAACVLHAVTL
jgi:hypothetical protein